VIVVDTDVLAIHHIFRKDVRFKLNERAYAEAPPQPFTTC